MAFTCGFLVAGPSSFLGQRLAVARSSSRGQPRNGAAPPVPFLQASLRSHPNPLLGLGRGRRAGWASRAVKEDKDADEDEPVEELQDGPQRFDIPEGLIEGGEDEEIDYSLGIDVEQYLQQPKLGENDPPNHRAGYVALVGKPNAGKSTLLNQLLGQKISIVTNKPQTTRHKVLGIISEDMYQMVLLDTPGVIMKKNNKMEEMMMTSVRKSLADADAAVAIIDASWKPLIALKALAIPEGLPYAVCLNKIDKLMGRADGKEELAKLVAWFEENTDAGAVVPMCAREGQGVAAVQEWASGALPLSRSFYPKDILSEHPERFFVSEIIREKIFQQFREEVPYSCQVNVIEFKERPGNAKDYVSCEIVVERETQKMIVLGKKGASIKKLGSTARVDVESFLGKGVHLELFVKVRGDWREDERALKAMGFKRYK